MKENYEIGIDKSDGDVRFAARITNTKTNKNVIFSVVVEPHEKELDRLIQEGLPQ
ncbi:hypothetical protein [Paenibacillus odorifer]|uniref:hypothetical protein n=1 Tax=Paenibacillus odorifer TaxID=189426 RepID=UPI0015C3887F|nr:hypothetical protein [Paenibacillus odorifer]